MKPHEIARQALGGIDKQFESCSLIPDDVCTVINYLCAALERIESKPTQEDLVDWVKSRSNEPHGFPRPKYWGETLGVELGHRRSFWTDEASEADWDELLAAWREAHK